MHAYKHQGTSKTPHLHTWRHTSLYGHTDHTRVRQQTPAADMHTQITQKSMYNTHPVTAQELHETFSPRMLYRPTQTPRCDGTLHLATPALHVLEETGKHHRLPHLRPCNISARCSMITAHAAVYCTYLRAQPVEAAELCMHHLAA
jgi:hypothetical protein